MTPDSLRHLFDANAMVIMFVWGILYTRLPWLAKYPNELLPWINAIGYIVAKFIVPDAHAAGLGGVLGGLGFLWTAISGGATSAATAVLYDKFVKPWLDHWLPTQPRPLAIIGRSRSRGR